MARLEPWRSQQLPRPESRAVAARRAGLRAGGSCSAGCLGEPCESSAPARSRTASAKCHKTWGAEMHPPLLWPGLAAAAQACRQRGRRGHSFGLTPPAAPAAGPSLCPGQGQTPSALLCVWLLWLWLLTTSPGHSQQQSPMATLSLALSLGCRVVFPRFRLCWEVSPDRLAPAGHRSSPSWL